MVEVNSLVKEGIYYSISAIGENNNIPQVDTVVYVGESGAGKSENVTERRFIFQYYSSYELDGDYYTLREKISIPFERVAFSVSAEGLWSICELKDLKKEIGDIINSGK